MTHLDIVHADIKPDNLLVDFKDDQIKSIKVIDFGSAFIFSDACSMPASTPEYLAPEFLEFMEKRSKGAIESTQTMFKKMRQSSMDIWALGTVWLEILSGFPLWLAYKGKITNSKGKAILNHGIFGASGRSNSKII